MIFYEKVVYNILQAIEDGDPEPDEPCHCPDPYSTLAHDVVEFEKLLANASLDA